MTDSMHLDFDLDAPGAGDLLRSLAIRVERRTINRETSPTGVGTTHRFDGGSWWVWNSEKVRAGMNEEVDA